MFGLPENFDSSFLMGRTLLQVCVGLHDLILRFDSNVEITVECEFQVLIGDQTRKYTSAPEGAVSVLTFLQEDIIRASGSADGTLSIAFPSGLIEIYDSSVDFECYQIRNDAQLYVV